MSTTTSSQSFADTPVGPLDFTAIGVTETDTGTDYLPFVGTGASFGVATFGTAPTFDGVQWGAFTAGVVGDSSGALQQQTLAFSYNISAAPGGEIFGIDGIVIGASVTQAPGVSLSAVETLTDSAGQTVATLTWNPQTGSAPVWLNTGYGSLHVNLTVTASIYDGGADTSADSVFFSGIQQTYVAGGVGIDKQVSVDGGKTWYDVGDGVLNDPTTLVGGKVEYRVIVTNDSTAGITLAGASVGDANGPGPFTFGGSSSFSLAAGNVITSDVMTATAVAGHQLDTATLTGDFTDGTHTVAAGASDTADYTGIAPGLTLDKQVSVNGGQTWQDVGSGVLNDPMTTVGAQVEFRVIVANTSPAGVTLDAAVGDTNGPGPFTFGGQDSFTLAAGATLTSDVVTATAAQGHVIDTATLSGDFTDNGVTVTAGAADVADYTGSTPTATPPTVTVDKQVSLNGTTWQDVGSGVLNDPQVLDGCKVYFRVLVTNTSTDTISGATVADSTGQGFTFGGSTATTIGADATITSDVMTATAVAGHQIDTATLTGTATVSGQSVGVTGSDTADYTGLQGGISVLKVPGAVAVTSGDQETYTFYVTNTGTAPLENVQITDNIGTAANPDDVTPTAVTSGGYNVGDTNHNGVLDAGETWQYTETVTLTAGGSQSSQGGACDTQGGSGSQWGGSGGQGGQGGACDTQGGSGSQWGGSGGQGGQGGACDTQGGSGSQWGGSGGQGGQGGACDTQGGSGSQWGGSGGQGGQGGACDTQGGSGSQWGGSGGQGGQGGACDTQGGSGSQWGGSGGQGGQGGACDTQGGSGSQWGGSGGQGGQGGACDTQGGSGSQWGGSGGQGGQGGACDTQGGSGSQWGGSGGQGGQGGGSSCGTGGSSGAVSAVDTVTVTATAVASVTTEGGSTCGSGGSGQQQGGGSCDNGGSGDQQQGGGTCGGGSWSGGGWGTTSCNGGSASQQQGGSTCGGGSWSGNSWSGNSWGGNSWGGNSWGGGSSDGSSCSGGSSYAQQGRGVCGGGFWSGDSSSQQQDSASSGSGSWGSGSWGSGSWGSGSWDSASCGRGAGYQQQGSGSYGSGCWSGSSWGSASCDQQPTGYSCGSGSDTGTTGTSGGGCGDQQQGSGGTTSSSCGCTETVTATDSKNVQVLPSGSNITIGGTAPTGNLVALFGTAEKLEFTFNPGDTISVDAGNTGTALGSTPSADTFLEISNASSPSASGAQIYFEGNVQAGENIFADATVNPLTGALTSGAASHFATAAGSELYGFVFTSQQAFESGAAPVQTLAYGTAGQMHLGDTVGSLQLSGYVGASGGHLVA